MIQQPVTSARARDVSAAMRALADPVRAQGTARFFKTGKGDYGEGDRFLGITVPELRKLVRAHRALPLAEAIALLHSPWHEERLERLSESDRRRFMSVSGPPGSRRRPAQ